MLRYRLIDPHCDDDIDLLVEWYNDRTIRHLSFPHANAVAYRRSVPASVLRDRLLARSMTNYRMYIIEWEGSPVGEMSVEIHAKALQKKRPRSAWLGVIIGEDWARGKGLGSRVMRKLETIAKGMGAERAELGVFEFNERAIRLYQKLGYKTFARDPKKTWWNGQMWDSLCMEKDL